MFDHLNIFDDDVCVGVCYYDVRVWMYVCVMDVYVVMMYVHIIMKDVCIVMMYVNIIMKDERSFQPAVGQIILFPKHVIERFHTVYFYFK